MCTCESYLAELVSSRKKMRVPLAQKQPVKVEQPSTTLRTRRDEVSKHWAVRPACVHTSGAQAKKNLTLGSSPLRAQALTRHAKRTGVPSTRSLSHGKMAAPNLSEPSPPPERAATRLPHFSSGAPMGGPDLRVTAALFVKFNRVSLPSWNQDPVRIPSHHDDLRESRIVHRNAHCSLG
jgi:hypothetical protein